MESPEDKAKEYKQTISRFPSVRTFNPHESINSCAKQDLSALNKKIESHKALRARITESLDKGLNDKIAELKGLQERAQRMDFAFSELNALCPNQESISMARDAEMGAQLKAIEDLSEEIEGISQSSVAAVSGKLKGARGWSSLEME